MPEIKRRGIEGCCVSSNFYDLGGAHSKYRSKDVEEFAGKLLALGYTNFNIAITNCQQTTERKYLEELGFKQIWASRVSKNNEDERIWLHAADNATLDEKLGAYREIVKKREEEKRQKALEEAKKKAESETENMKIFFKEKYSAEFPEKILASDIMEWLERFPHATVDAICKAFLGDQFEMMGFARRWSYNGEIARGFNSRLSTLRKRAEREALLKAASEQSSRVATKLLEEVPVIKSVVPDTDFNSLTKTPSLKKPVRRKIEMKSTIGKYTW